MFDIGFSEIIVCCIVALIVIGPERLPETVRTVGLWIGRLKRSLRETRGEIERQMGVDDIRRQLHNEDIMRSLEDVRKNIHSAMEEQQLNSSHVYPHEPELPDHAHMDEQAPEQQHALEQNLTEQNTVASANSTTDANIIAPTDSTKTP